MNVRLITSRFLVALVVGLASSSLVKADALFRGASAFSLPHKTPRYSGWRLVAASDLIVRGKLRVPVAQLRAAVKNETREVVSLRLDVTRVLKGKPKGQTLEIADFSAVNPDDVSLQHVLAMDGKDVTVFLTEEDDPSVKDLYFVGHTTKALLSSSQQRTQQIPVEVANQKRIAAHFARPGAFASTPLDDKVKRLIDGMLKRNTQFDSFDELEKLGMAAVPATIRWMDDRRPLGVPRIVDKQNYGPGDTVLDALDAILKKVTGEQIGSLSLFSSEAHRKQTVNAWRTYLYYGRPKNNT